MSPATASSGHRLNAASLSHAGRGLQGVNSADCLIDQQALEPVLGGDPVAPASLDGVDSQPLPAQYWVYPHPKIRVSPHISGNSPDAIAYLESTFVDNVARFVAGRPLIGVVDPGEGYRVQAHWRLWRRHGNSELAAYLSYQGAQQHRCD